MRKLATIVESARRLPLLDDSSHWPRASASSDLTFPRLPAVSGKPVIVLTGCGHEPGRATRVEQAGGSALLLFLFTAAECAAVIGSCVGRTRE